MAALQFCFWEPVSLGEVQAMLSGRREELPMVYEPVTTTGPELLLGSVAFWQAISTNSPKAIAANVREEWRIKIIACLRY